MRTAEKWLGQCYQKMLETLGYQGNTEQKDNKNGLEVTLQSQAFVAFAKDTGAVPTTHMVASNFLKLQF